MLDPPQTDHLQFYFNHCFDDVLSNAGVLAEGEGDILEDIKGVEEGRALKEHPHLFSHLVDLPL